MAAQNNQLPNGSLDLDLNATIASAVNARIEAQLLAAFSSDDVLASYVTAALQQPITYKEPGSYQEKRTTWLNKVLADAIREATKAAVATVLAEHKDKLEAEVRKVVRSNLTSIAEQFVEQLVTKAGDHYGLQVQIRWPGGDR